MIPTPYYEGIYWVSLNYETQVRYQIKLNEAICILVMFRIVHLFYGIITNSAYFSLRMQRLSKMVGCEVDSLFAIKCYVKKKPILFITTALFVSIFVFSFCIRVCEIPLRTILGDVDFGDYMKVYWFVVVTMATVGYGDITPKTLPGRVITFILAVWGVFLISLVVLLFFEFIQLSDSEKMALKVYDRMSYKDEMVTQASIVLSKFVKIRAHYKGEKFEKVKDLALDFKRSLEKFREKSL